MKIIKCPLNATKVKTLNVFFISCHPMNFTGGE